MKNQGGMLVSSMHPPLELKKFVSEDKGRGRIVSQRDSLKNKENERKSRCISKGQLR